nr:MAG TPA: Regulatory protein-modification, helix-turn-helix, transcriptional regulator, DNA [Caudoviricetes sp.]
MLKAVNQYPKKCEKMRQKCRKGFPKMMNDTINLDEVRAYIRSKMAEQGVCTAELIRRTGIARGTLDNFFDGSTQCPSFDRVAAMILALDGSVDEALGVKKIASKEQVEAMRAGRADMLAAHAEMVGAKDEHIDDLHRRLEDVKAQNVRLLRWHRFFLIENIFLATCLLTDLLMPTLGYFRGRVLGLFGVHVAKSFMG